MILALAAGLVTMLPATRFQVVNDHGLDWLIDPNGKRFLSFGVCCVDPGTPFKEYDPSNPSYAAWKSYPDPHAWAADTISRLQKWGFNTIGAWSDIGRLRKVETKNLYFTPILHMGSGAGAPWRDMWDPAIVKTMDQIARDQITPLKDEGRVIGYFSDNEQGWWEGALFDWAWKGPGTRGHLLQVLRERYPNWPSLAKDFEPVGAGSLSELAKAGRLYLRPGGNGMPAVQAYMKVLAGRYYSLCRSIIKRYDPKALYLGDRYISNFYPEVAAASAPFVDVVSTNLNADWNDGTFAHFYLPTLERLTGKPIMITEYYMAAKENRSGNKNDSSGFPVVQTQVQRADGFKRQTEYFARQPYVVGAHWFQYYDEPKNGRGDGENYDMGLVDVENQPYEEITHAAGNLDLEGTHRPGLYLNGPRFGNERTWIPFPAPLRTARLDFNAFPQPAEAVSNLEKWMRESCWTEPEKDSGRADLYLTQKSGSLYAAVYWNEDRFGEAFYRSGKIPEIDRARIEIEVGGKTVTVVAGEGGPAKISAGGRILSSRSGVRNTVIVSVPMPTQRTGSTTVSVRLSTRARAYRGSWRRVLQFDGKPVAAPSRRSNAATVGRRRYWLAHK